MNGGIYNAALFGASQREARGKLEQMAGIKRPPSGILASSPELMQAAMPPAPQPMMPQQPMPAATPTVQPALPQVPAPTAMAPAPQPTAPAPQPQQQQPTMMQEGGPVDVRKTPVAEEEEASKGFMDYVRGAGDWMAEAIVATYGTGKAAEQAGRGKKAAIDAAVETGDEEKIVNTVLANADVPITDEGKQDFARNVFGLEDVNDIDEINRRIADVAISSAIGESPDKFAQAVLLGLQNYKQTASARAAAKSGGSGMSPLEPFPDAVRDLAGKIMTATGEDPAVAIQQARDALAPYYTGQAGPTTTETTETATVTIEQHKSANDAAKQAGQKTYTLGGQEFQVQ